VRGRDLSRATRRAAFEAIIDRSEVAERLGAWMPAGGRHRQLSAKAVLLGLLLAIDGAHRAHLVAGWEAVCDLDVSDQVRLGVVRDHGGVLSPPTYRQFAATHQVMTRVIDPTPVPSFKGVADDERAEHLAAVRAPVDSEAAAARLVGLLDALVEASVPVTYHHHSTSLAVDWTDQETWSRPRGKTDPQPANDPDASWGHAKRNAPGAIDQLFFGFYGQVATMVREDGGAPVPELVRRMAFAAPTTDPAALMAATLLRAYGHGVEPGDVAADCGYSNREPTTFALPLRRAGAHPVMDLHPHDRGPKGTFAGAIVANGNLFCPGTPPALLALGPLHRGASDEETAAHDQRSKELARYKLGRISSDDEDGAHRVMCPAAMGKLRCPRRPDSMALDFSHPEVLSVPEHPSVCCVQKTVTVPEEVTAKTAQRHDYPSRAHRLSYMRRTAAERTFAWLQDPAIGMRRGWSRLFGLTKNSLLFALAVVVRNVRVVESFERQQAEDARRHAMGLAPRRRRRRHRREPDPGEPPPSDHPRAPG
jgi:hypothetical protein